MMDKAEAGWMARALLRGARSAVLATQREGQPFASLVTPAMAPDLSPLMWLSGLSEHTRQLLREPRCALFIQGAATEVNPQTAPRVTVTGLAERVEDHHIPALKARWLALHPYAELYAGFGDFALWRLRPEGLHVVGGFAAAFRLRPAEWLPDAASVHAIAEAEAAACEHMNVDHPDILENMAVCLAGQQPGAWRMVAVDVDGCDLIADDHRHCRVAFKLPVVDAASLRDALVTASAEARACIKN
jgi:putative heme iron utilization protein